MQLYNTRLIVADLNTNPDKDREDNNIVFDIKKRSIKIFCKIDRNASLMMESILEELAGELGRGNGAERAKKGLVTVVVNTPGGLAFQGLAIYDQMRTSGLKFRTIILGEVASSGLAVALAGHERWMHKHATLHFHAAAMQFEQPLKVIEQYDENIQRAEKKIINKLYNEITLANSTKLTARKITNLDLNGICITAEEARKFGLIHKIIGQ